MVGARSGETLPLPTERQPSSRHRLQTAGRQTPDSSKQKCRAEAATLALRTTCDSRGSCVRWPPLCAAAVRRPVSTHRVLPL